VRQTWEIDVGYEQFLGPELFFNPEILNPEYTTPLANLVDQTIMHCPVDTRRGLFSNIVVAGGSTKFKGFDKRLQRDLNRLVKSRYEANLLAVKAKLNGNVEVQGKQMEVHVSGSKKREIASWLGGSYVASQVEVERGDDG
jgi:singapore isolate B (sub-type 7) whole genome shotgun sequence assembly, scaffold_6